MVFSMPEVAVVRLGNRDVPGAAALLARSFLDEPNLVHLLPDVRVRARALPLMFRASCRDALRLGHLYGAFEEGVLLGVAVWTPPGGFPLSLPRQLRAAPQGLRILAATRLSFPRILGFMGGIARLHPPEPHWYLESVGVEPERQARGVGSRLLEPVLAIADRAREPCYLETAGERTVAWYRRLGFEVRQSGVRCLPGGPPTWTMLRQPDAG
jgi:ribosomal protein S18 acetylase RimI-like enzyme